MTVGIIVEGHGEVEAFPIVVGRLLERQGITDVEIPRPFRLRGARCSNRTSWLARSR
jgi:hypothetical protein